MGRKREFLAHKNGVSLNKISNESTKFHRLSELSDILMVKIVNVVLRL